jgi:hypothetical protein
VSKSNGDRDKCANFNTSHPEDLMVVRCWSYFWNIRFSPQSGIHVPLVIILSSYHIMTKLEETRKIALGELSQ